MAKKQAPKTTEMAARKPLATLSAAATETLNEARFAATKASQEAEGTEAEYLRLHNIRSDASRLGSALQSLLAYHIQALGINAGINIVIDAEGNIWNAEDAPNAQDMITATTSSIERRRDERRARRAQADANKQE